MLYTRLNKCGMPLKTFSVQTNGRRCLSIFSSAFYRLKRLDSLAIHLTALNNAVTLG